MKRIVGWTGLAMILATAGAWGAEFKLGVINVQRLERESPLAERASKKLEKEFAPRLQELQRLEKQIKDKQAQAEKDAVTMSEAERRNLDNELGRLSRDFQRVQREYREDLNVRRNEEFQVLYERTSRVIKQIAEAEKYDLILQEAVYVSPRLDITDKVIKGLAAEK